MKSIPAVLLVDTGVDDAFAIALAARSPQIDLLGLVASFGNSKLENTLQNTLWLTQLLGVQTPVCKGSAHAFCEPDWVPEEGVVNCHGDRGLGPVVAPNTLAAAPASEDAVAFLAGLLERSEEPVALIPVGPLTDVARFVVARPDLIPKIRVISLMGGAGRGGNVTPFVEANISSDPEAAATVFGCGAPIVMCGLDCTRDCVVTAAMVEQLRAESEGELAQVLCDSGAFYLSIDELLHDPLAVACLIDEGVLRTEEHYVDICLTPGEHRGQTVVDWEDRLGRPANVQVGVAADPQRFWQLVSAAVKGTL